MDLNKVTLFGRLGRDAEVRSTPTGKQVATLSVATDAGKDKPADWHRVKVWDPHQTVQLARKGDMVLVDGKLTYDRWEDKEGRKQITAEVVGFRVIVVGRAPAPDYDTGAGVQWPGDKQLAEREGGGGGEDEDLPF